MMQFNFKSQFNLSTIIEKVPLWQLLSFAVLLIGYIGFYTYCEKNNLPYLSVEFTHIIAFGIFNATSIYILYFFSRLNKKSSPYFSFGFIAYIYLDILTKNPVLIALGALIFIFSLDAFFYKEVSNKTNIPFSEIRRKFKELKIKKVKEIKKGQTYNLFTSIFIVIYTILMDYKFLGACTIIYYMIYLIYRITKLQRVNSIHAVMILLVFPSFITYNFLDSINFTFIGISNNKVIIQQKDSTVIESIMKFKDGNFVYLNHPDSNSTKAIALNKIDQIIYLKDNVKYKKISGIELLSGWYKDYFKTKESPEFLKDIKYETQHIIDSIN